MNISDQLIYIEEIIKKEEWKTKVIPELTQDLITEITKYITRQTNGLASKQQIKGMIENVYQHMYG